METRGQTQTLLPLLQGDDETLALYALNLIGDDKTAFDTYFSIISENRLGENIRSDITDVFKLHADEVKENALAAYKQGKGQEYMLEILSRLKNKDDEVYNILLSAFLSGEETPIRASYLAAYGDERALPYLMKKIEDTTIGFVEFQELKYAIEALGGEYDEPRDFSADKDYIAVEAAAIKAATPTQNGLKS
jgi:hypothetical protein